jgi:hypothetical protein
MGGCGRFLLVFPKETVIAMKIAVPETVKVVMPKSEVMTMGKTSKFITKSAAARNMRCHASVSPPKPQECLVGFQVFVSNRNHSEDSSEYFLSLKPCAIFDWRNFRWLDLRPTAPKHVRI